MSSWRISGLPVVKGHRLVGILTNRDVRFVTDKSILVSQVMTSEHLVTVPIGTTLEQAKEHLHSITASRKLLVVDDEGGLVGLITIKDIEKIREIPQRLQGRQPAGCGWGRPWA